MIAMIDQPAVIEKILTHLGLPTEPSKAHPARPPPEQLELPELAEPEIEEPIDELPTDFCSLPGDRPLLRLSPSGDHVAR